MVELDPINFLVPCRKLVINIETSSVTVKFTSKKLKIYLIIKTKEIMTRLKDAPKINQKTATIRV
jgi:hypothetical protein